MLIKLLFVVKCCLYRGGGECACIYGEDGVVPPDALAAAKQMWVNNRGDHHQGAQKWKQKESLLKTFPSHWNLNSLCLKKRSFIWALCETVERELSCGHLACFPLSDDTIYSLLPLQIVMSARRKISSSWIPMLASHTSDRSDFLSLEQWIETSCQKSDPCCAAEAITCQHTPKV